VNSDQSSKGWGIASLTIAILLLLILVLYRETSLYLAGIWAQWRNGSYGHGFLVLAISLYLVFYQRKALAKLSPCPSFFALVAVAIFSMIWMSATLADVQVVQSAVLLALIMSVIWAVSGPQVAQRLLFPLLFIGFALPVWSPLLPFLQAITTDVSFWLARISDVPALRLEHLIILPAGQLLIGESCSGLHYLLAALTLGVLYAYLNYQRLWSRFLIVMIAAGSAIIANILRVFIVVYLAYATGMQHPLVADHLSLGWYLFGGLVLLLLFVDAMFHRHAGNLDSGAWPRIDAVEVPVCNRGAMQRLLTFAAAVILIASGPALAWWIERQTGFPQEITVKLPAGIGGWSGPLSTHDSWIPTYHGAFAEKGVYRKAEHEVYLYVGYYPSQTQGQELINDLNRISSKKNWQMRYPHGRTRKIDNQMVLEQVLESSSGQQRLVWYWYSVAGWLTTNEYEAKVIQVLGMFTGNRQASVIALAADFGDDAGDVRKVLRGFLSAMGQPLAQLIDGDR